MAAAKMLATTLFVIRRLHNVDAGMCAANGGIGVFSTSIVTDSLSKFSTNQNSD
jgi:hypothetical protein